MTTPGGLKVVADKLPATFVPPDQLGAHVAASEARAKHAGRTGDEDACRQATEEALRWRAVTFRQYKAKFQHGRNQHSEESNDTLDSSRKDWLRQLGKSDETVRQWERYTDDAVIEVKTNEIVGRWLKNVDGTLAANYSSETNEWYTPARYIEAVRELYGGAIDLDPATCAKANETVQAAQIFTLGDDALMQEWQGCAFLNPPYGTDKGESVAGQFCRKAIAEHAAGRLEQCVILVNSVHSQKWQAPLYAFPVCLVDHRIAFVNGHGERNENPTFQNVFFYLGSNAQRFAAAFREFGYVVGPIA